MKKYSNNLRIHSHAGFSLIDIMVGMVIALLGVIIIFQVFSVSEGIKRTTTSGGDALQNGAAALFSLERSLKGAGYGIFSSANISPIPSDPAGTAPVTIAPGAANASDSFALRYRQNWDFASFPPDPSIFPAAVAPVLTCETISVNAQAQLVSTTILDPTPVAGGCPAGTPLTTNVISDGIALMKVEYGTDADGNGVIDSNEWSQAAPANVMSVLAVRVAMVARSSQPEKPGVVGGACDTTTAPPPWIDSASLPLLLTGNNGLAVSDDWKCYRYKTFETTVPLRNVVWRP